MNNHKTYKNNLVSPNPQPSIPASSVHHFYATHLLVVSRCTFVDFTQVFDDDLRDLLLLITQLILVHLYFTTTKQVY